MGGLGVIIMKTYKYNTVKRTQLNVNNSVEGETIETKLERIVSNKEPIKDGAPIIFRERKDGVSAGGNIRSDRFDIAIDAMDKVAKDKQARRAERMKIEDSSTQDTSEVTE